MYTNDMTKGNELIHILKFTLPMLMGNLFQQLYNIVDSIIVGKYLGYQALASVGATGSITYLFYTLCIGLATGTGILVAQKFGAMFYNDVKRYIVNSAYVIIFFGIIFSIVSAMATPLLLKLLNTPDSVFNDAVGYMRISCIGTIAVALYNWICSVMRSLGDVKTPLCFLIIASILNVCLDMLFVVRFNMGINGTAWATILSQMISTIGSICFAFIKNPMFKMTKRTIHFDKSIVMRCIRMGIPLALQNALVSVSMIYLQRTANHFGDTVMATYTATMRIEQLIQQPFSSLSMAISAFTGQNIGANKHDRVIKCYKQSLKIVLGFSVIVFFTFLFFSGSIMGIFVDNKEVISIGTIALKLSSCFYLFLGIIHVTRGLLNGASDVKYTLINGISEVVSRIGFASILSNISSIGYMAVWGTTCITWLLTAIISIIRYLSGKWKVEQ